MTVTRGGSMGNGMVNLLMYGNVWYLYIYTYCIHDMVDFFLW